MVRVVDCKIVELVNLLGLFIRLLILHFELGQRIDSLLIQVTGQFEFLLLKKAFVLLNVKWIVNQFDFHF